MKTLNFIFLAFILISVMSCSQETDLLTSNNDITSLDSRSSSECEGCSLTLTQNGCTIDYSTSEGCGEIVSVVWSYPGGITFPNNGPITAATSAGTYGITVKFSNGCVATASIEIEEGCDTLCEDCTVTLSQNGCRIDFNLSPGCGEIESVTWLHPGGIGSVNNGAITASSTGGKYRIDIIFTSGCRATACIEIDPGCETRCDGCVAEIEEEDCTLTVDTGTCEEGFIFLWSIPVPGGRIESNDYFVEIESIGTYCVTIIDPLGCESTDCFEVLEPCECEPEFELNSVNPKFLFGCNPGSGLVYVRPQLNFRYSCNDCCKDLDEGSRELSFTITRTLFNVTKGLEYVNIVNSENRSLCSSKKYGTSGRFVNCENIDAGDVLKFNWSVSIDGSIGCDYTGDTYLDGALSYTVKSSDIADCCD